MHLQLPAQRLLTHLPMQPTRRECLPWLLQSGQGAKRTQEGKSAEAYQGVAFFLSLEGRTADLFYQPRWKTKTNHHEPARWTAKGGPLRRLFVCPCGRLAYWKDRLVPGQEGFTAWHERLFWTLHAPKGVSSSNPQVESPGWALSFRTAHPRPPVRKRTQLNKNMECACHEKSVHHRPGREDL